MYVCECMPSLKCFYVFRMDQFWKVSCDLFYILCFNYIMKFSYVLWNLTYTNKIFGNLKNASYIWSFFWWLEMLFVIICFFSSILMLISCRNIFSLYHNEQKRLSLLILRPHDKIKIIFLDVLGELDKYKKWARLLCVSFLKTFVYFHNFFKKYKTHSRNRDSDIKGMYALTTCPILINLLTNVIEKNLI